MADAPGYDVSGYDADAVSYPWAPVAHAGVLADGVFTSTDRPDELLAARGTPGIDDRHGVVAVGSNGSAAVMHRKMRDAGVSTTVAMTIDPHESLAVGHSAHVSMPGYIAAAPYRCPRCRRSFVTVHVDDDQLAALDATEPNYVRSRLGSTWIYASRWGVLAIGGLPISLRSQADLHTTLADADPVFRDAVAALEPDDAAASLAHDGDGDPWRHHWASAGFVRHDGFTDPHR